MSKKTVYKIYIISILVILVIGALLIEMHKNQTPKLSPTLGPTSSTNSSSNSNKLRPSLSSIVQTKSSSSFGQYLIEPSGQALYTYSKDKPGVSNCTGSCLAIWPAYVDNGSSTNLPNPISTIKRNNGQIQFTYKGLPLYTYVNDNNHTASGNGVAGFYLAKP